MSTSRETPCICVYICCALDGMENKLYKMHGTYIKIHKPLKFPMQVAYRYSKPQPGDTNSDH